MLFGDEIQFTFSTWKVRTSGFAQDLMDNSGRTTLQASTGHPDCFRMLF